MTETWLLMIYTSRNVAMVSVSLVYYFATCLASPNIIPDLNKSLHFC